MAKDLKLRFAELARDSKKYLDDKGVTQKVNNVSQVASEQFDTVSGHKVFKLVEERLEIQNNYNDLLAEKLEEALQRIAELEMLIKKGA